jgi:hypothetical protein
VRVQVFWVHASQQPSRQGGVGDHRDSERSGARQQVFLDLAAADAVLHLDARDGADGVEVPQLHGRALTEPNKSDQPLRLELVHGSRHLLHRHLHFKKLPRNG